MRPTSHTNEVSNSLNPRYTKQIQIFSGKISSHKADISNTQSSVPTYDDERVKVKPCDLDRVPYLPDQVMYLIASALPNPKSVLNLALASKDTWKNLRPALLKCEVTYESRLGQIYGGTSSDSLQQHFSKQIQGNNISDNGEEAPKTGPETPEKIPPPGDKACQHGRIPEQCVIFGDRIRLENRPFESPLPDSLLFTDRRLTALHSACKQGPSALQLARDLIRSAQVHQPSYIDGVGLQERTFHHTDKEKWELTPPEKMPPPLLGDLPPPLFFAVAHGNMEVFGALIEGGCSVNLLQGQSECQAFSIELDDWETFMSFKVHKECMMSRGETADQFTLPLECVCQWFDRISFYETAGCLTAGHVAIQHDKMEMLEALLRGGLDVQKGLDPLINYAVALGNVAAVKTLLEHDPSLFHRREWNRPLIHAVPFIEKRHDEDNSAHYGRIRHMLEYLIANGANVDSESDAVVDVDPDDLNDSGLTALQTALEEARVFDESMPRVAGLLTAAEVLIRGGAAWNRPILSRAPSDMILDIAVVRAAGLFSDIFPLDETETTQALESRKGWGRLVKAMIETWSQAQADANNVTANRANTVETFSNAFTYLVNFHDPENGPNRFGPWGTEAVGKLLLSTGITPSPADMEKWKILCRNREASWISEDGDRSQREFLLAGVDVDQIKIE